MLKILNKGYARALISVKTCFINRIERENCAAKLVDQRNHLESIQKKNYDSNNIK
jgi:hypothetical protein